jgi:hypothetical protein
VKHACSRDKLQCPLSVRVEYCLLVEICCVDYPAAESNQLDSAERRSENPRPKWSERKERKQIVNAQRVAWLYIKATTMAKRTIADTEQKTCRRR